MPRGEPMKRKTNGALHFTAILVAALVAVAIIAFAALSLLDINNDIPPDNSSGEESSSESDTPAHSESESESESSSESTTETVAPPIEKRISFLGCGDNIIYYGNVLEAASLAAGTGKSYNFKPMYSKVADYIAGADIAFINQETLMTGGAPSYYPCFNSPQELALDLLELGFDVVNIANNHMLDQGDDGLVATIEYWNTLDVTMIGGYLSIEDFYNIRVVERDGIKIAFLALTEWTNGILPIDQSKMFVPYSIVGGNLYAVPVPINEDIIREGIERANEAADFVIVSMHWGFENGYTTSESQRLTAQLIADCGADVIIGHHAHVIQPVEYIVGKDGNKTLCVYSLGNFLAEQEFDFNMLGGMISFDIVSDGASRPHVENVVFIPTVIYFNSWFYNNSVYPLEDFTEELAQSHGMATYDNGTYSENHHTSLSELYSIVRSVISSEFLPASINQWSE